MDRVLARRIALAAAAVAALAVIGVGIRAVVHGGEAAPPVAMPAMPAAPAVPPKAPALDVAAQRLAARLEASGSTDPAEWELLGKAQLELRQPEEAAKAFERARQLRGATGATSAVR